MHKPKETHLILHTILFEEITQQWSHLFSPPSSRCAQGRGASFMLISSDSRGWEAGACLGTVITSVPCNCYIYTSTGDTICRGNSRFSYTELRKGKAAEFDGWLVSSHFHLWHLSDTEKCFNPEDFFSFLFLLFGQTEGRFGFWMCTCTDTHTHTHRRTEAHTAARTDVKILFWLSGCGSFVAHSKSALSTGMKCKRPWKMFSFLLTLQ